MRWRVRVSGMAGGMMVSVWRIAVLGLAVATCGALQASAQPVERLVRPGPDPAEAQSDPARAGLIEAIFNTYASLGAAAASLPADRLESFIRAGSCDSAGAVYADEIIRLETEAQGAAARARLEARDPEIITSMSMVVLETLEDVPAGAIAADEAIGPGVYHDALRGVDLLQSVCRLLGDGGSPSP